MKIEILIAFKQKRYCLSVGKAALYFLITLVFHFSAFAQCPVNMDFEAGSFDGWTCLTGSVSEAAGQNNIILQPQPGPVAGQHTMLSAFPGDGLDEYGSFPKNCPNGSGHSIRLGNDLAGGGSEGISYQFVIPPTSNKFTLTYNYAVVFEDPGHVPEKQPRLEIEIRNVTDNEVLNCFSFTYIADNSLPGFRVSPFQPNQTPILYKDWTENTVYLNNYEGKTILLTMRTADCTYGIHFGYAYLDVSSKCDNTFAGQTFCPGDTMVQISAPHGYQQYNWYNTDFSQLLGTQELLQLDPPPASGTTYAVELIPYVGYGCRDTLFVDVQDTLRATAIAGPDQVSCNGLSVQLGVEPIDGIRYKWTPAYGLTNPNISNPMALPAVDTTYVLEIRSVGGGCYSTDTVKIFARNIDQSIELIGDSIYCQGVGAAPILKVKPVSNVQWYKDGEAIFAADQLTLTVTSTGDYYARLTNNICSDALNTRTIHLIVDTAASGIMYPEIDVAYNFPIQLRARYFNNTVLWTPATHLDNPGIFTPYFKSFTGQLYTILIANENGCVTVDTQLIKTHKEIAIYVPTAFTPGDDGVNDYLRPLLLGFEKVKYFRVFNRWGKLLFESQNDFPGWNGRVNNQVQETQTVVWMLEAVDIDGKTQTRKGTTLLMH